MVSSLLDSQSNGLRHGQAERTHDRGSFHEKESLVSELPVNFAEVTSGIYRSSFPQGHNLPAMKRLGLKTIVTFVDEPYSPAHQTFLKEGGITHHQIIVEPNKDPTVRSPDTVIANILEILATKSNHPVLVHCNKGKHRTGCVVGCLRKLQGWSLDSAITEYLSFSHPKSRLLDEEFIESFDVSKLAHLDYALKAPPWHVPTTPKIDVENDEDYPSPKWYLEKPPVNRVNVI